MSFPKKFLWFPVGWQDRGAVNGAYVKDGVRRYDVHTFCGSIAHVGKENGELFLFCPRCLVNLTTT